MVRIIYLPETVDCTADPHPVNYGENLTKALDDVVKVCSSALIMGIRYVDLRYGNEDEANFEKFESDQYTEDPPYDDPTKKPTEGEMAKKYRIEGFYFYKDANVDAKHHLPIGLVGVKEAVEIIKRRAEKGEQPSYFHIGVVWAFAGSASCSDYIDFDFRGSEVETDYSSQDWWIEKEGYIEHCRKLSELIEAEITPNTK